MRGLDIYQNVNDENSQGKLIKTAKLLLEQNLIAGRPRGQKNLRFNSKKMIDSSAYTIKKTKMTMTTKISTMTTKMTTKT